MNRSRRLSICPFGYGWSTHTHTCIRNPHKTNNNNKQVNWENVRLLGDGEIVSIDGTHLGENKPDNQGLRRFQINMAAVAGLPIVEPDL
jgi:hypothetical protein